MHFGVRQIDGSLSVPNMCKLRIDLFFEPELIWQSTVLKNLQQTYRGARIIAMHVAVAALYSKIR